MFSDFDASVSVVLAGDEDLLNLAGYKIRGCPVVYSGQATRVSFASLEVLPRFAVGNILPYSKQEKNASYASTPYGVIRAYT
jgi:hypothetical protein